MFNENDIPLNLYGNDSVYQSFPNIGEHVKDGVLCAIRREKKEESLFTQSYDKLKEILMSDDKFTVEGMVVDINIRSNNPEILDSFYNDQLRYYYNDNKRFCEEVDQTVSRIIDMYPDYQLSHDLQKLLYNSRRVLKGDQYIKEGKVFSNTVIEMVIMEKNHIAVGDKVSDRYGGKGVVSEIIPDELMMKSDLGETVDCIINSSTCVNRLNPGQLMETSITHSGARIISLIKTGTIAPEEAAAMLIEFLQCICPEEAFEFSSFISCLSDDSLETFLDSILATGMIYTSVKPITDTMTMDKLAVMYDRFPWIKQSTMTVPMLDSNGNIRYIESRRPIVCGKKYMYRLKQYAEEKFSVTSLSSTNIKNQNTRSKANKNYKSLHANTPIQFGDMETADMQHIGMEYVVTNLMIHSVSPQARRLVEEMLTGDPFAVNVELDKDSTNRNVEIVNAYLKTKGLRLEFRKIKKVPHPIVTFDLVVFDKEKVPEPIVRFINDKEVFDYDKYYAQLNRIEDLKKTCIVRQDMVVFDDKEYCNK
jgi:DNA-directed RNA polymerase beta subunit